MIIHPLCYVQGCAGGILRGCGRQTVGAVVIFCGYYLVGLPVGIPLLILTPLKVLGRSLD